MKVCSTRTHYEDSISELGLTATINEIGYENVLQILPCYCGGGEYFYTIIYKDADHQTEKGGAEEMKTGNEHLFAVLKEVLRHPAIGVYLKENGKIKLFFDGCCECDIEVQNYIDLRYARPTEKGGVSNV